jgi:NADH-quinone oxidoreductase subunit C
LSAEAQLPDEEVPEPQTDEAAPADAAAEAAPEPAEVATEPAPEAATEPAEAATEPAPEPEREPDPLRDPILAELQQRLGDAIVGSEVSAGDIWVRVDRASWQAAAEACRDMGFDYFCFLSGLDWLANPNLSGEKIWDPAAIPDEVDTGQGDGTTETSSSGGWTTGVAGGDTRFQVFARLYSLHTHLGITLKADLDDENPSVDTWTNVYRGADWHEREAWEMYGFDFIGHPGLRHIYLPTQFEGFPLRKDFPLLAREVKPWPGLVDLEPMPGEDEADGDEASEATGDEAAATTEGGA